VLLSFNRRENLRSDTGFPKSARFSIFAKIWRHELDGSGGHDKGFEKKAMIWDGSR
jgi:hypothetical protein